jgi:hypothetical protein
MKREVMTTLKLRLRARLTPSRAGLASFAVLAIWSTSAPFPASAQVSEQSAFPTATDASESLFNAVKSNDEKTIANILGGPTELTSSGDQSEDKADREMFVRKYQEMHRVALDGAGSLTLYIGAENWPFPIPLVVKNGGWRFDPEAGQKEVTSRRIGENELAVIAACQEFATSGIKHEGPTSRPTDPEDGSPAGLFANARPGVTSAAPVLFRGYYFQMLGKPTGKFTVVAYPAAYRSSGVMTFVALEGRIYEKDLGASTSALASTMTAFRRDTTWRVVDE